MNGTTRCPHCETRFKITDAQINAHQGMVRCGHCMQSFDARPTFIPDQTAPQLDQSIDELGIEEALVATGELHETEAVTGDSASATDQLEHQDEGGGDDSIDESTATEPDDARLPLTTEHLPSQAESEDALDFSQITVHAEQAEIGESMPDESGPVDEHTSQAEHDVAKDVRPVTPGRRTWPWAVGILVLVVLLAAQSAYFFRVGLAARLPALKPALVGYCHLLRCSVPLPQNAELISIESSGLEAAPDHDNEIAFSALLRNRASYALAFPVLALTLNDDQDKTLARRLFMPADYLPSGESLQTGFATNHEVSIKLRLNTADLRPAGYRLELFYSRN